MDFQMFMKLLAAMMRDELNATIILDGNQITVVFKDGTKYLVNAQELK